MLRKMGEALVKLVKEVVLATLQRTVEEPDLPLRTRSQQSASPSRPPRRSSEQVNQQEQHYQLQTTAKEETGRVASEDAVSASGRHSGWDLQCCCYKEMETAPPELQMQIQPRVMSPQQAPDHSHCSSLPGQRRWRLPATTPSQCGSQSSHVQAEDEAEETARAARSALLWRRRCSEYQVFYPVCRSSVRCR